MELLERLAGELRLELTLIDALEWEATRLTSKEESLQAGFKQRT